MSEEGDDKPGVSVEGKLVVTDLLGLGKAVEKLNPVAMKILDAVIGGAGKVYEPASIYLSSRAKNAADRDNALADTKAYLDLQTRSPAVLDAMKHRILGTEYRRQENITAAQMRAIEKASKSSRTTASDINPDFMAEWLEGVKDVSEEAIRDAWATLLAKAPTSDGGRVEKALVDYLKSFDAKTAVELKYAHQRSAATDFKMPKELCSVSDIAIELGMGTFTSAQHLRTDIDVSFSAVEGSFFMFNMSARAKALGEVLFGWDDPWTRGEEFVGRLRLFIDGLARSPGLKVFHLEIGGPLIADGFRIQCRSGHPIPVEMDVEATLRVIEGLELEALPFAERLKGKLRQMAQEHILASIGKTEARWGYGDE